MRTDRRAQIFVAATFLAMIVAPGLIQAVFEIRQGERPGALDVFRRPPTARNLHAYEQGLEKTSLVAKQLRPGVQYLQWRFLADAGEKAVVGRHGWLFYRPSVRYLVESQAVASEGEFADPLPAIRSFRDQLRARRIRLLVVPVPNKESIYPGMLARRAEGAGVLVCEQTRRLLDRLEQSDIEHVDLFEVFRRARQQESGRDPGRLYLAQDSHWSPEGVRLAAVAVARRVLDGGIIHRGDRAYAERPVTVQRHGDLVQMLRVPQIEHALDPENATCLQVVESDDGTPYRDATESEVLILGDSFLRIYEQDEPGSAGFIAHVARELGQPLASIVNDGGASTLVRQALARRPSLLRNTKLVIWEFAEREIRFGTEGWKIVPLTRPDTTSRRPMRAAAR
ncbi:MAG: alginate O-acetyltransferase AlgX-related protein [Isosphaeraceae bacterium]